MRMSRSLLVFALFVLALPTSAGIARAAGLAVGDPAPSFVLQGSDGRLYSLEEFAGKREIVLAWFPKAFTPG